MSADLLFEQVVRPQHLDAGEPIATVQAQDHRSFPVILQLGPRVRVLLTPREATGLARALVDAVQALNPN